MLEQDATPETSNTTEPAETQAPETQPEGGEDQKPKANGFQKRIDRLTREKYELQGRLRAYEEQRQSQQPAPQQDSESDGGDTGRKIRTEAEKIARDLHHRTEMERQRATTERTWRQQETEAKKQFEDYEEVVPEFVESWRPPRHVEAAILECEKPVAVTYYLAKHPEEAEEIVSMSPFRAAAAIGKIEARLDTQTLKKQSAAPEPIAPVKPRGKPDDGLGDDLSTEDWIKRRNAQQFKKK